MGKAFGIVMIVLGIYVGMELYTEGMQNAFGGALVRMGLEEAPADGEPARRPTEAIRDRVLEHNRLDAERKERLLEQIER